MFSKSTSAPPHEITAAISSGTSSTMAAFTDVMQSVHTIMERASEINRFMDIIPPRLFRILPTHIITDDLLLVNTNLFKS